MQKKKKKPKGIFFLKYILHITFPFLSLLVGFCQKCFEGALKPTLQ